MLMLQGEEYQRRPVWSQMVRAFFNGRGDLHDTATALPSPLTPDGDAVKPAASPTSVKAVMRENTES